MHSGLVGLGGLGLSDLLRGEAKAGAASAKSMIVLWLWGGPSHMETFDLKPDSPSEFRGEFRPIHTNVPGIDICEHLPRLATLADKFAIIRSCHHDSPGHANSTHTMLTGYPGDLVEAAPFEAKYPDVWSVTNRALGPRSAGMPSHVALPHIQYNSPAYLGKAYKAMKVAGDPNAKGFAVPTLGVETATRSRLSTRTGLLQRLDGMRRELDLTGSAIAMDEFQDKALAMLTSGAARRAFEIDREDPRTRDRYGRHAVGQRMLLARRLIEAGVRLVTIDFPHVPGQKAFSWDDHASVWNIFTEMKARLPILDQVVSALISDLSVRGLLHDTMVVVMGEMSHTPRINYFNGQPGREHWSRSMSIFMAGGGLRMGQAIGATNSKGEEPAVRPLSPNDVLATWYKFLGVPLDLTFADHFGRPTAILPHGEPIAEFFA